MKIKSYFAKTVDEAIAKARIELGSEALLLNTRKTAEGGTPAGYEVVMGVPGGTPARQAASPARGSRETRETHESGPPAAVSTEIEKLRAQMDELQTLLVRSAQNQWMAQRSVPEVAEVYSRLIEADVDPLLSKDIADRLEAAMATDAFFAYAGPEPEGAENRWKTLKSEPGRVEQFLQAEMQRRVTLRPRLGVNGAKGAVAALVGPAGSGKTSSLAKLAVAASAQRPVRLLSLDRSRTGGQQLLRSLASPEIKFFAVESPGELPKLVAEARQRECVLIDTPGYSAHERNLAEALAGTLASCRDIDVHLVVPAYMKARDLRALIHRYEPFRPSKLLATRLDETETVGTIFSEAAHAGLALSFLAHGPRIPDDIRAATVEDLAALVRERPQARAQHAA